MQARENAMGPEAQDEISEEAAMLLAAARNAAFAEASQGRLGHGLDLLQAALQQEPQSHDLLSDMAALLLSAGELHLAAAHARQALEISPHHGPSIYSLAFAQMGQGQLVEARDLMRRLVLGPAHESLVAEAPELMALVQAELDRLETLTAGPVPAAVHMLVEQLSQQSSSQRPTAG
ncbi:tetratricopeptide repeat protein [Pelomonas sp. V22]|uniref:tetratricopeptide repeat protein n=1 Tax=Pelomonas sp. V22 TaxID=2822139 RepID=UPI0024A8E7FE|nr:tetratricopeptide repeat protein [Pelomonas sp. V22]MDI4633793.1 tetratricopeptide repeat protein [Pelomonas sp. V22]